MKMNSRTLFFPFTRKAYPLIHMIMNCNSSIEVASYRGSGLIEKDIAYSINQNDEGLVVKDIFDIDIENIDELVILDSELIELNFEHINTLMMDVKKRGINLIVLSNYIKKKLNLPGENDEGIREFIYNIDKPIIYVTGIYDTIFNSFAALKLKNEFSKRKIGSKILTFDSNLAYMNCCVCDLLLINSISLPKMAYYLRKKIQESVNSDDVDILIIQVPGGLVQSNEKHFNDFGIYYTILSDLASPDYIFCNLPYDYFDEKTIIKLNNIIKYRTHGKDIDSIMFNNYYMKTNDSISLSANEDIVFMSKKANNGVEIENEIVLEKIKDSFVEVVNEVIMKLGSE